MRISQFKNAIVTVFMTCSWTTQFSQNPVGWNYAASRVSDRTYEIHITARIESGWHLYSQTQPKDAIAIPTAIKFNKNPLVIIDGTVKELGKLQKHKDAILGLEAWQYSDKVEFVQKVKLRGNVKTNTTGTIEYQVCTDEMCLPPKTIQFSIKIE